MNWALAKGFFWAGIFVLVFTAILRMLACDEAPAYDDAVWALCLIVPSLLRPVIHWLSIATFFLGGGLVAVSAILGAVVVVRQAITRR